MEFAIFKEIGNKQILICKVYDIFTATKIVEELRLASQTQVYFLKEIL